MDEPQKYEEIIALVHREVDRLRECGDDDGLSDLITALSSSLLNAALSIGDRQDARGVVDVIHKDLLKGIDIYFLEGKNIPIASHGTA
jgi:hypothetical protein